MGLSVEVVVVATEALKRELVVGGCQCTMTNRKKLYFLKIEGVDYVSMPADTDCSMDYPPEVRRGKYWGLGVFLLQYFPLVKI